MFKVIIYFLPGKDAHCIESANALCAPVQLVHTGRETRDWPADAAGRED